jgi:transposase
MANPTVIKLGGEERKTLSLWARSGSTEQRIAERARIIIMIDDGKSNLEIAKLLEIRPATVSKWRTRFGKEGLAGLHDAPRSGQPAKYNETTERRILALLDEPPPEGYSTWTGTTVARRLGDVSDAQVWRVLRRHNIHLKRRRSWCVSTDPEFASKAADIIGLYLDPPENALVLCVDEKPHIQALERAQGWLKLPDGKALTGYSHNYKRHGTTTLFAALEVVTGQVKAGHFRRRRRREFLQFMNEVISDYEGREIHVILDNLNTHKPKNDQWLSRHRNIYFHYTPTHASWLNQIEVWFSILSRSALRGASFTSPQQVRDAIDRFLRAYNIDAAPFEWRKKEVGVKTLKNKYADLCR